MEKVVLITGTNSGFGKLMVKLLSDNGHMVYAGMRNTKSKNADAANELNSWNNVSVLDIDITNKDSVNNGVKTVIEKEGKLDVLVNNAGVFVGGVTETYTEEDFSEHLNVNLLGPWRMMKAALPQMRKQNDGLVINISSGLGRFSAPFMTIYNSAKFALEGLVEGLHHEVKHLGVEMVLIEPGAFPTEIFGKAGYGSEQNIAEEYGDLAKVPEKIGEGMGQLFASENSPNPQLVADAVKALIDTPKGQRNLRTVVDPITGTYTESANKSVKVEYDKFLTAFGMSELL